MRRKLALLWLMMMPAASLYLGLRLANGLGWRTDLMALLPRDEQDAGKQRAEDAVTQALSERVVLLVGHADGRIARQSAATLASRLTTSGLASVETLVPGSEAIRRLATLYAPYRRGLLSDADRAALLRHDGASVAGRAVSQVFGFVGAADARLLRADPFLLLPGFFTALPVPFAKLQPVDGVPMVQDGGIAWALVVGRLSADPYALATQDRLKAALDLDGLQAATPGLQVKRLGAAFFAEAGAKQALDESSFIGLASAVGTALLILLAYRAASPLWMSLLVIAVGIVAGLATSLLVFGELHVATLLFGVSLIGVAVDYSLQYCTEIFAAADLPPEKRLARVRMGIALGTTTTVIGYLTLLLAPFPGLHQIATFSAAGLVAAWLTVTLWLPILDRSTKPRHGRTMLGLAARGLGLWQAPLRRWVGVAAALLIAGLGLSQIRMQDDVRRMQSLSAPLVADQQEIRRLIGGMGDGPFLLVRAADDEAALRLEETLAPRLARLRQDGALADWLAPARYVPSASRQIENRALVRAELDPMLAEHLSQLALSGEASPVDDAIPALTLPAALAAGAPLGAMLVSPGVHVVLLDGIAQPRLIAQAVAGLDGVVFVDPAGQFSALLGKYRLRAIGLLALSAVLMAPMLAWRYGGRGALRVMLPPTLAVVLAPALRALCGGDFSFFDAMALVLVLSIGVDYAIFFAETSRERAPVTMLAVALAAGTALLSFGLLAMSEVAAVRSFGSTMALGILLAFLLAPMARGDAR